MHAPAMALVALKTCVLAIETGKDLTAHFVSSILDEMKKRTNFIQFSPNQHLNLLFLMVFRLFQEHAHLALHMSIFQKVI